MNINDWRNLGRNEIECPHGVGHGQHIHGCDGCCGDESYEGAFKMLKGIKNEPFGTS